MKTFILTEKQFDKLSKKLISEAVGVPQGILEASEKLYKLISEELKKINTKESEYNFYIRNQKLKISDIVIKTIHVTINVEELESYDGKPVIASMGVANEFNFDEGIMMQVNKVSKEVQLTLNYIVSENWEPNELYDNFVSDEIQTISVMSHELKHKYDRTKKTKGFVGDISDYQAYSSGRLRFGIPIIDQFMRYSYYIQNVENLVRPTEVSTRMIKKGINKETFYDFITNDETFLELKEIQNFSYDFFIKSLYEQMEDVDSLIEHAGGDPSTMSEEEKVEGVLKLVYVNLVNLKTDIFDHYFYTSKEKIDKMFGGLLNSLFGKPDNSNEGKEKIRNKYWNYVMKYKNNEMKFFKDECERFNYVSTKLLKKISKIYSLIPDDKEVTNESIINWELHHKLMEKKYGKRKIQTTYNYKNFK